MWNKLSVFWCKSMHNKAMWPIHGRYVCPQCLREYRVAWEHPRKSPDTPVSVQPAQTVAARSDSFATM
jgi:hypothetical protein